MKVIPMKCPECGATIQVEEGRNKCFCTYCGTQLYFDDEVKREVHEHIHHEIDEAEIRKAEAYEEIEKQRLEKEAELKKHEMDIQQERRTDRANYIIIAVMAVVCFLLWASVLK